MSCTVKTIVTGLIATNTYILRDTVTGDTAVIDPAKYTVALKKEIELIGPENIKYIISTHRHFDHILGIPNIRDVTAAKVVISETDAPALWDDTISGADRAYSGKQRFIKPDITVNEGDTLNLGSLKLKFIMTPGHSAGSMCILVENIIFSGDTLFFENIGRTDFDSGSYRSIIASVKRLATLDGDYRVLPGHGNETTLEHERLHNRYVYE